MNELDYKTAGDKGILIYFRGEIGPETFQGIWSLNQKLLESKLPGAKETTSGYRTLFVSYEPSETDYGTLVYQLKQLAQNLPGGEYPKKAPFEIPVVYDGPDLPMLAQTLNVSEEEIIQRYLADDYLILTTGPGGGLAYFKIKDKLFDLPRKKTPTFRTSGGGAVFAAGQGGFSGRRPLGMEGKREATGWWFIGRTPLRQWLPDRDPPLLIKAGDWIRYKRIEADELDRIAQEVDRGTYELKVCET